MSYRMVTIIKYRILLITVLFGAFGGALSLLLKIEDLKSYYPSLAILIAFSVSLLISFLIKAKWSTHLRNQLKVIVAIVFFLFLATAFLHTYYIIGKTFEYRNFDEVDRYVKGDYSAAALTYKKKHPDLTDEEALYDDFGGVSGISIYWTPQSVNKNILILIISYCMVILFFVACVSLLTEILAGRYSKSSKRIYS